MSHQDPVIQDHNDLDEDSLIQYLPSRSKNQRKGPQGTAPRFSLRPASGRVFGSPKQRKASLGGGKVRQSAKPALSSSLGDRVKDDKMGDHHLEKADELVIEPTVEMISKAIAGK